MNIIICGAGRVGFTIAKLLSDVGSRFQEFRTKLKAFFLIIIPALLIAVQPDPGTMLVFACFIFLEELYVQPKNFRLIFCFVLNQHTTIIKLF